MEEIYLAVEMLRRDECIFDSFQSRECGNCFIDVRDGLHSWKEFYCIFDGGAFSFKLYRTGQRGKMSIKI